MIPVHICVHSAALTVLGLLKKGEGISTKPEEVGHIITCTALRQSFNTWPLQPAESADYNLCMSKTIPTDVIRNVRSMIIQ